MNSTKQGRGRGEVLRAIDKPLGGSRGWSDKVVTGREGVG